MSLATLFILLCCLLVTLALSVTIAGVRAAADLAIPWARPSVLTPAEQALHGRIAQVFPDHVVLAKVALPALVDARGKQTRRLLAGRVAGFVLCTRNFDVRAIIELDERPHRTATGRSLARDRLLAHAGLHVIRYAQLPSPEMLRADVQAHGMRTPAPPVAGRPGDRAVA